MSRIPTQVSLLLGISNDHTNSITSAGCRNGKYPRTLVCSITFKRLYFNFRHAALCKVKWRALVSHLQYLKESIVCEKHQYNITSECKRFCTKAAFLNTASQHLANKIDVLL